jgi:hypothetical protein
MRTMRDIEWEMDEAAAEWASRDGVEIGVIGVVLMAIARIFVR